MADILAGQVPEPATPAVDPPVAPAPDIEARLTQMQQQFDERIKGFQTALNTKDAALKAAQQEALNARLSGMTEDEKADAQWQQTQAELSQLRQENALLSLSTEYPEELPAFRQILAATTPKEQLDLIRALRKSQAAAAPSPQATPAQGEPEVPPIDPNNPSAPPLDPSVATYNGQPITMDWADRVLGSVQRMIRG